MSTFRQPTKEQIKQKYGITNDDFDVLVTSESPDARSGLVKVINWPETVFTWLLRRGPLGTVVAVIFVVPMMLQRSAEDTTQMWVNAKSLVNSVRSSRPQLPIGPLQIDWTKQVATTANTNIVVISAGTGGFSPDFGPDFSGRV